jgi:putative endonuclease
MKLFRSSVPADVHQRGRWAEQRAAWYLRRRGWRLCARNWIGGGGELDLVCSRWKTLLIAEVRFRSDNFPFMSIDQQKINHLRSSTRALVQHHGLYRYHLRCDAIGVFADGYIEQRKNICRL